MKNMVKATSKKETPIFFGESGHQNVFSHPGEIVPMQKKFRELLDEHGKLDGSTVRCSEESFNKYIYVDKPALRADFTDGNRRFSIIGTKDKNANADMRLVLEKYENEVFLRDQEYEISSIGIKSIWPYDLAKLGTDEKLEALGTFLEQGEELIGVCLHESVRLQSLIPKLGAQALRS